MSDPQPPDPLTDVVAAQYERWTYPPGYTDLESLPLTGPHSTYKDFRDLHTSYWPTEPYREDRDILVAGCGTMAAACYAYLYPAARVVGIDLSTASLAHEQLLKDKYRLGNLSLHRLPIEQAGLLRLSFDFIACHGVLHHLTDPVAGLCALREVLRRDGVIAVMLYAKYGRAGVYMLQDLFRLLGVQQDAAGVALVRQTLAMLPPSHPAQQYLRMATDLHADAGLVDTFLHPRDRAYTVRDCLNLARDAGVAFQGWDENMPYSLDLPLAGQPADNALRRALASVPEEESWTAAELLRANMPVHFFHVCRADRDARSYRVHFHGDDFLRYIPVIRYNRLQPGDLLRGLPPMLERPPVPPVPIAPSHVAVLREIDSRRTIAHLLRAQNRSGAEAINFGRELFGYCWRQ
ncbi:MAG TPA: class I SAM-dependent methyltransferase, partial [Chthoniobacteraceae bacterium]|nr:class I SAM-dependent methyltransferase [Chthoniobacteraceae bacterium]